MEPLYKKLYEKYTNLKRKKESETEELSRDQELKFLKHVSAADELIEHLRKENNILRTENSDLRSEVASIRSAMDKQYAESQKLMMDEIQKYKELSEEIERLQYLKSSGNYCNSRGEKCKSRKSIAFRPAEVSHDKSDGSALEMTGTPCSSYPAGNGVSAEPAREKLMESHGAMVMHQPECCRRTLESPGIDGHKGGPANCIFQALAECLLGMKLSYENQAEGMCITVLHQSSGYSFSLTWVTDMSHDQTEVLYRVSSLGTFHNVAPEWMKEMMMFSVSMCPVFFDRISRVVKLH